MKTTTYHPMAGERIYHSVLHASRLSKQDHCLVRFKFNDVPLFASPKKSPTTILWEWEQHCGRSASNYRSSKAGIEAAAARDREIVATQEAATTLIGRLPGTVHTKDNDLIMRWVSDFTKVADDVAIDFDKAAGLRSGGLEWVALCFESVGFKENDLVGEPPESFNVKDRLARYIVGQVINCARRNMPPHPCCDGFVERYFRAGLIAV